MNNKNFLIYYIFLSVAALGASILFVIKAHTVAFYIAFGLSIANLIVVTICFVLYMRASRKSDDPSAEEQQEEKEDLNP